MKQISVLLLGLAFVLPAQQPACSDFTATDLALIARRIYVCGQISGMGMMAETDYLKKQAAERNKESGCEEMVKLLDTLDEKAREATR